MKVVLIVEDSKMLSAMISRKIRSDLRFDRDIAFNFQEARALVEQNPDRYFVAVVDLNLPDAPNGEIVDYLISKQIPVIVFTNHFNDEIRETMMMKNVVDYIIKEGGPQVIDYLMTSIDRFYKNQVSKILVVDDSSTSRCSICTLLEAQKYIVYEAGCGTDALSMLDEVPDIKLVITDYNMPGMDGFELVSRIRQKFPPDKLAIIGMSAYGTSLLSSRFLKSGASDFLTKPFLEEELFCRINQNIRMIEYIEAIGNISNIDPLTGIYNRSYLFRFGPKLFENAKRGNLHLTTAMIDIDQLGKLNDRHGYEAGDEVVKEISTLLTKNFRAADIVTRFGGSEFCIIATNMNRDFTQTVFERIRTTIESKKISFENLMLPVTVSIGVTTQLDNSLESMVKQADRLRVRAKDNGRNCVIIE